MCLSYIGTFLSGDKGFYNMTLLSNFAEPSDTLLYYPIGYTKLHSHTRTQNIKNSDPKKKILKKNM